MRPDPTRSPLIDALYQAAVASKQRRIYPKMWTAVMRRDNSLCRYCGARATEVDHVEPWSRGGLTVVGNLAAACQACNRSKGDRTPDEWQRAEALKQARIGRSQRLTRHGQIESAIRKSQRRSRRPNLF
jgi:5-methylcytosine-specific restriction endonuclease McrA